MKNIMIMFLVSLMVLTGFTVQAQNDCEGDDCVEVAETQQVGLSEAEILAYEVPEFDQLTVSQDRLNDRWYHEVQGELNVYDAPNGNLIRTLDAGFNFMTVLEVREDGWTQINAGEWVRSESLTSTNHIISQFTGIFLPEEMPQYTHAWLLVNLYPSLVPGGNPRESNGLLYRYTPVTIYATVEVDGWDWYQIGVNKWILQTTVSKVQTIERPESVTTDKWVAIDLYEQSLVVYEGDRPIFATLVSTGLPRWPTYEGTFNIYFRRIRDDMTWGTPGDDFYYLEEVPWTMFFDEGRALHGAYWHDGLGYRRSHGCVNMSITDAHWLYNWVAEDFDRMNSPDVEEGPNVYVYSSGEYR